MKKQDFHVKGQIHGCIIFPRCGDWGGGGGEIRPFSSILGPEIRPKSFFYFFFRKKLKKMEKTGNSIQSGSNLKSFASFEGLGPKKSHFGARN